MPTLRLALAQLNVTVGDLPGNAEKVAQAMRRANAWRADLLLVPELAVTGYPPEDLLLKPGFVQENLRALAALPALTRGLVAVVGVVDRDRQGRLYNAMALLSGGRHLATYHKRYLPNYGVFDEPRYFTPGSGLMMLEMRGIRIGLTICEDLWEPLPARQLATAGCRLVVNISASPYQAGKGRARQALFAARAKANRMAVAYCNLVGGQDELVFDGASMILDAQGKLVASGAQFTEDLVLADLDLSASEPSRARIDTVRIHLAPQDRPLIPATRRAMLGSVEEVYRALVLGTRDYVRKNGFETVVLGLSGGIDSALTACIGVDALGPEHVVGMMLPSRYSSRGTQQDATQLAKRLGIRHDALSIEPCFRAYLGTLERMFAGCGWDVTEQNLQARIRGNLLMALSNKFGWLVLTTGNKSELATGYCTLYGDMAGGFAVIRDVPKTLVYQLARWRNQNGHPIPESVFRRAPTAELAPNQTDQDSLPPYEVLDPILKAYVEEDRSLQEILQANRFAPKLITRTIQMVDRSEYKRRQAPPGVKITPKAFGKDRRMPITNRYHQS
jgi:NAD+ synthase (glutamine-hydrolysing)